MLDQMTDDHTGHSDRRATTIIRRAHIIYLFLMVSLPALSSLGDGPSTRVLETRQLQPHPDALPNTHRAGEVDNPALVPFIVKHPRHLPGIVVDETQAELVGTWQYSTHTPPYVGLGYLHDRKINKGKSSVTFRPNIPCSGLYEVRLSHCYNVRRATNTPITIRHARGVSQQRINQQDTPAHGRLFRSLGQYYFHAGQTGWVRISNAGTDGKYVIADAVQFIPIPQTSN